MENDADEALCELGEGALAGSVEVAWSAFERAWPALLRRLATFQRALGVRANLRDDCGQAVLLRVWKGRSDYRGSSLAELLAWLRTICRREHVRLLESEARSPRPESELAPPNTDEDLNHPTASQELLEERATDTLVDARDELSSLETCIAHLDESLREVTELLYSADAPTEREVAELLGCSKSQVNVLRQKALRALAACMQGKEQSS